MWEGGAQKLMAVSCAICIGFCLAAPGPANAASCAVDHQKLLATLKANVMPTGGPSNGGLDNNEWAAVVSRDGTVCDIAYSGKEIGNQWLSSRAIAAEKANTANGMSLPGVAISTANLYAAAQPGGYLYGAAASNPPNPAVIYSR
jgi:hypothetical protein